MSNIFNVIRKVRAILMRNLITREGYLEKNSIQPVSTKYGFDRGKPIDRHFIEKFIGEHKHLVKGHCLEVVDDTYIRMFGGKAVEKADVIDIFVTKQASIHGDLRDLTNVVKSNTFDCIIITQTLHVNDDFESAIKECYRILKPGGTMLATFPTISPTWNLKINMWRLSVKSANYVFSKYFDKSNIRVKGYGSKVSSLLFWTGFAIEDISPSDLEKQDESFPTLIGIKATK